MNEHERTRTRVALLLGGALDPDEERAIRVHLAQCTECSRQLEISRRLVDAVASSREETPAPELVDRIVGQAQSRRLQFVRERRQAWQIVWVSILGWALVLVGVPVWQAVLSRARVWLAWPGETGPVTAFLAGAVFTYLFLPGLLPLLAARRHVPVREMKP